MPDNVAVVGAGLVGCLAAAMLARLGFAVDLYEARSDPRIPSHTKLAYRSINLAMSARGIAALRAVDDDMASRLLADVTPMKGRMIHSTAGALESQRYSTQGECINSIDRHKLNISLLNELDSLPNVNLHFNHKLLRANFHNSKLTFCHNQQETTVNSRFTVACDGHYSKARQELMKAVRMDFSQTFIPDCYLELSIPPNEAGQPQLDTEHLHIWPRHNFMLIALPNSDNSFTCTLFAPFEVLESLKTDESILAFFRQHFNDALPLMGEPSLLRCFAENPKSALGTIRCKPYHYKDKAIIIGDAAHSMVPFYGQGMNCGFEDVRILQSLLISHSVNPSNLTSESIASAFQTYTETRHESLEAITKLALRNYNEMASKVTSPLYKSRKFIDGVLTRVLGRAKWSSLYEMVTFRWELSYAEAMRREQRQQNIIDGVLWSSAAVLVTMVGILGWTGSRR